ncbi:MAG: hypothetical protein HY905_23935 [Deltaproteobacteria bacterium]|nr:hypothetical protein [Deltaproteobacteria bacterium]
MRAIPGATLVAALLLAACGPRSGPAVPAPETLAEVCAAPRDEERPPLLTEAVPEDLREWLGSLIAPAATPAEARARAESALASFRALEDPTTVSSLGLGGMVLLYLQVLEAVWLLEPLWPADAVDPPAELAALLEPVYEGLRLPAIVSGGFVQQLGGVVVQLLAESDASGELIAAALQLLRILPDRARVLQRHVALPLVCDPGAPPDLALEALRHLADAAGDAGNWHEGLALQREIVRRAPENVDDAYELAVTAYRAGRVEDGDQAAADADALCGTDCDRRPASLERYAAAARVLEQGAADDPEARLALAAALEAVARNSEAKDLYETVASELPDDARPLTGLARLAMTEALDVAAALPLLESAGPDHRDADYYELLVACRAMTAFYVILPQLAQAPERAAELLGPTLASVHEAAAAYLEFQPARASVVLLLLEAVEQGMEGSSGLESDELVGRALQAVAERALDAAARFPDSPEVARLVVATALFAPTADEAFAALERPLPAELARDLDTAVRRAALFLHGILRWNEPGRADAARALIDDIPAEGLGVSWATLLRADLAAASWRLGAGATAEEARDAYLAAIADESLPAEQRARALNNLGVVLAALGDPAAAERLRRAEESSDEDYDIAQFNRLALAVSSPSPAAEALENLRAHMVEVSGDDGQPATMRRLAWRWLAWTAEREGKPDEARAFLESADALPTSPYFFDPLRADLGVLSRGEFQFGLGYSSLQGLVINLDTGSWLWLVVPPPG